MTVHGRYPRPLVDSPVFDQPYNALPGVDQDAFVRTNMPLSAAVSNVAAVGTGVAIAVPIFLRKGDIVTSITFVAGGTGAGTPTNHWHALYDPDGALLAQSADALTAAWAQDTAKKLALSAPQTLAEDGVHFAATMMTATTPNTWAGSVPLVGTAVAFTGSKALGRTFGSSLTGTAPATISTPTTVAKCPLVIVS